MSVCDAIPSEGTRPSAVASDRRLGRVELVGVCLVALGTYWLLGQRTFYREDGLQLVYNFLLRGNLAHDIHPLYLPIAKLFSDTLSFTGWGIYRLTTLFSAVTTAAGLFFVGLLARRAGLDAVASRRLLLLVGACPPIFFFATVVEFHACFFLFVCIAFWLAEGLVAAEVGAWSWRRCAFPVLLACCTFAASLAHSTGSLLLPLLGAWVAARTALTSRFVDLLLFALVHLALVKLARPPLLASLGIDLGSMHTLRQWFEDWVRVDGIGHRAIVVAWREVLLPYFPHSLVVAVPFFVRVAPAKVYWAILGFLPYYLLCVLVLADRITGEPIWERGSYLVPLSLPAAWIFVRSVSSARVWLWRTLLLVAIGASFVQVWMHDERPGREFGVSMRAILDDRETIMLVGTAELPWTLVEMPKVTPYQLVEAAQQGDAQLVDWLTGLKGFLDGHLARGGRVLLTANAKADLQHELVRKKGALVLQFLEASFASARTLTGSVEAWELRPKS